VAIIAKAGSKSEFEPCPEGPQVAVCCDVIDLGIVEVTWQGETKRQHKCEIRWQSADLMADGKPYLLRERFTLSLHEKANLRRVLEAWRGKKFTDAEAEGFDVEKLLGANCYVNVVHRKGSKGGTFANLASIMPMPRGMTPITPKDYTRVVERDSPPADGDAHFDDVPPLTDDDLIPF
jgi:hypothetical protein